MGPPSDGTQSAARPILESDLLGCWRLIDAPEERGGQVRRNPNYGDDPTGYLHYLPDGRVAVMVSLSGRVPLSSNDRRNAPVTELAAAARTFDAYAGSFAVIAPDHVVHRVEISLFHNEVGKDLLRRAELVDDRLTLFIPPFEHDGQMVKRRLVWQRV